MICEHQKRGVLTDAGVPHILLYALKAACHHASTSSELLLLSFKFWGVGRVVEGGSLENCSGATHRGFESLTLRQQYNQCKAAWRGG